MTNGEYRELVEFPTRHFTAIDQRFGVIERRLDAHDERFREILGHFDAIYRWLERLQQEYHALVEGLRRIDELERRLQA